MITVIDYGVGNIRSVVNALAAVGASATVVGDAPSVRTAEALVLPGVGSFRRSMETLRRRGLDEAIRDRVLDDGVPLLGICLGMQLLGAASTEDGASEGLGLIDGVVDEFQFDRAAHPTTKVPHVGFDTVTVERDSILLDGLGEEIDFYFTHSFRMTSDDKSVVGTCWHGERFAAVVERGNVLGTQFHPEKSQSNGLSVLRSFLRHFRLEDRGQA